MPRVSIVLPVLNAATTLPATLASLQAQTLTDWELIAVDDGSTDASPALLKRAAAADRRMLFFPRSHAGVSATANAGLRHARAPFVARMDADDLALPERLARQVAALEADPSLGFVGCQVRFGGDPLASAGFQAHVDWLNAVISPEDHAAAQFCEYPLAHPTLLGRRAAWDAVGPFREGDFPEDYEWFLRAMESGLRFAKVPETLLVWNDPPSRLTRTDPRYAVEAFFAVKLPFLLRWWQREMPPERPVWIWGAGRVSRRRVRPLLAAGLPVAGWIDIDPAKIRRELDGLPVCAWESVAPLEPRPFILAAVSSRGARVKIAALLEACGWKRGRDFLPIA